MIYPEKTVELKDGGTVVLRTPRIEDAPELLAHFLKAREETEFLMNYPEELTGLTVQGEEKFIESRWTSPNGVIIIAEVDGCFAGMCTLDRMGPMKVRHRAEVAISLYRKFWGRGVGTALMNAAIQSAREMGLRQVELTYIEGNERGAALYRKLGFEEVCAKPDAFRFRDGSFRKEYAMIKYLD